MENYDKTEETDILKTEFKNGIGKFIPLFKIHENDKLVLEIQTSNFEELEKVFNNSINESSKDKNFELDDDF